MWFRRKKRFGRQLTLPEMKSLTRVLVVDDRKIPLVNAIASNGWHVTHLRDIEVIDAAEVVDSHILCIDVLGVGKKLRFPDEGLGLVRALKERFPYKKVLLYSSQPSHNVFDPAIDLADARVSKTGEVYPFLQAIQRLATDIFQWDACLHHIYETYAVHFSAVAESDFRKAVESAITSDNGIDQGRLAQKLTTSVQVAGSIASIAGLALSALKQ